MLGLDNHDEGLEEDWPLFGVEEENARVAATSEVEATQEGEVAATVTVVGATLSKASTLPSGMGRGGDPIVLGSKSTMGIGALGVGASAGSRAWVASGA